MEEILDAILEFIVWLFAEVTGAILKFFVWLFADLAGSSFASLFPGRAERDINSADVHDQEVRGDC